MQATGARWSSRRLSGIANLVVFCFVFSAIALMSLCAYAGGGIDVAWALLGSCSFFGAVRSEDEHAVFC
jgi:hypothetical protein